MPIISRIGAAAARGFGLFGLTALKDAFFNYVTLLLPGNGTNGAQNNTFLDSSSNAFTITRNGNTTQGNFSPFSQTGWGNYFNGSTDQLSAGSNAAFSFGTGAYTVEAWVYTLVDISAAHTPVIVGNNTTNGFLFVNDISSSGNLQIASRGVGAVLTSSGVLTKNTWNHVVAVRSGTGTNQTSIFLNGTRVANGTDATNWTITGPMQIGGVTLSGAYLNGYMSNVRVVKGTAVYDPTLTTLTVPTSPLTAITNTSLLTCQSNRFIDNSSNAFALTVTGTPSVQAFSPFAPTAAWSASTNGGSGYFDGSGDYLSVADNTALQLGSSDFTWEGWFYLNSTADQTLIFSCGNTSSYAAMRLIHDSANSKLTLLMSTSGSAWAVNSAFSSTAPQNSWVHVAIVRSGTSITAYQNGVSNVSTTLSGATYAGTLHYIGARDSAGAGSYLVGYAANVRLVKGTAVYTANFTPPTAPLTAISGTSLLLSATNGGIVDATAKNDLETVGNAQISTTQSKFGGSSMYFDGTGDYLVSNAATPNLYAFGTGDFTIECWARFNSLPGNAMVYDGRPSGTSTTQPCIYVTSGGTLAYFANGGNAITSSAGAISTNTWYHIAVSRSGTSTKMFLGGTQAGSTYTDSTSYTNTAQRPVIGVDGALLNSGYLDGYIDDLRVTKGVARYTANFTPPTTAFPLQ